jgi:hypothetical protein
MEAHFRQYHTKYPTNHGDHTCLYRYANEMNGRARHLVPHCIQTSIDSQVESKLPCYGSNTMFGELKRNNVTSKLLMQWFAPIDLISDYEDFLISGIGEKELFCNCSQADYSFGTRCQYQLAVNTSSFSDLIDATFVGKEFQRDIRNLTEEHDVTCYLLFNCTIYTGFCLDWRQICDGKRDCINGRDEERCMEKELNECDEKTEYRCLSGHCIPRAFSFDLTFDCPDWDDEQKSFETAYDEYKCGWSALANCEEKACTMSRYSCGDGECYIDNMKIDSAISCTSQRDQLFVKRVYAFRERLSEKCWRYMICNLGLSCLYELSNVSNSSCQDFISRPIGTAQFCDELLNDSASCSVSDEEFFLMPSIAYPYVHVLYKWQKMTAGDRLEVKMICYNMSACNIKPQIFFNSS